MRTLPVFIRLVQIEIQKMMRQRVFAFFVFWFWLLSGLILPFILILATIASTNNALPLNIPAPTWDQTALFVWEIPNALLGRLLFICLASYLIASEYSWKTWRTLIPHTRRVPLLAAKYMAFLAVVMGAFAIMSVSSMLGTGIIQAVRGQPFGELSGGTLIKFASDYLLQVTATLLVLVIGVALTGVLVTFTRSMIGGVIGGLFFVFSEIGFIAVTATIGVFTKSSTIESLRMFTISANIGNIQWWIKTGSAMPTLVADSHLSTLSVSFIGLLVFAVLLFALHMVMFSNQELT